MKPITRYQVIFHEKSSTYKVFDDFLVCFYNIKEGFKTEIECKNSIEKIKDKDMYYYENNKKETFLNSK